MGPILPSWVQSLSPVDLEHDMALYMLAGEYMTLPASQYSVLDGAKVERLTDDTFRVSVSAFAFFNFTIEPILTVCVQPTDTGCRIELLACKLAGSKIIESQNSKFSARMVNNGKQPSFRLFSTALPIVHFNFTYSSICACALNE